MFLSDRWLLPVLWALVGGAAALQSLSGFGFSLIVMPLLTLLLGLRTAAPLVALFAFTLNLLNVARAPAHVRWRDLLPIMGASAVGVPLGVYALTAVDERPISALLGAVLIAYAAYTLLQPQVRLDPPAWAGYVAGFVGGCLGGAYNTSGPPVILYAHLSGWPRHQFRSTLQGFFLFTSAVTIIAHTVARHMNTRILTLYGATAPVLLAAVVSATVVDRRLNSRAFQVLVNALLLVMGGSLLLKAL